MEGALTPEQRPGEELADGLPSGWAERLLSGVLEAETAELDGPHLVVCHHAASGVTTFHGPYPNALAATTAVVREEEAQRDLDPDEVLAHGVVPLFAVLPSDDEDPASPPAPAP